MMRIDLPSAWRALFLPAIGLSLCASIAHAESVPITSMGIDVQSLNRLDTNSDIWTVTWGSDNNLYAASGDGNGCDGSASHSGVDVNQLTGGPTESLSSQCTEQFEKPDHLPKGIVSVGGTLYLLEQEFGDQSGDGKNFSASRICSSTDAGVSWTCPSGYHYIGRHFAQGHLINYGKDYANARDTYVYMVGQEDVSGNFGSTPFDRAVLARMPKTQICGSSNNCAAADITETHEYLSGYDGSGNPTWSSNIADRAAIFLDVGNMHWGVTVNWNPVLDRYLLCYFTDDNANLRCLEGPEPWGPWTEVFTGQLADSTEKFSLFFVNKNDGVDDWISDDGKTWWFLTSGVDDWDSINVLRATLTTSPTSDPTPPPPPSGVAVE